jgi:chorismate dehydratase
LHNIFCEFGEIDMSSNGHSKLRMAPRETIEEVSHRLEREQRASQLQRESSLEQSLAPFRVGSVRYLNAVPLTRGVEGEIIFATPSKLAEMLERDELDAALVSVTEVLLKNKYDVLDGIAIASLGEVKSVVLAHRKPLAEAKEIFCDTASLTSVQLLRVLLAEQGIKPHFKPLTNYDFAALPDYALLIGDPALDFLRSSPTHEIWDLGEAWSELTKLPFVYAVWALKRGIDNYLLRRKLSEARDFGLDTLDHIISTRTEYDRDFRQDYLSWHIHYHLGADEKQGLAKFSELLDKHGCGPVYKPKFVI